MYSTNGAGTFGHPHVSRKERKEGKERGKKERKGKEKIILVHLSHQIQKLAHNGS